MPPLGWYLAQGLSPLGSDSSDDEEGPCELPDGRLVCGPHGLTICCKCCVDYNFGRDADVTVLAHPSDYDSTDKKKAKHQPLYNAPLPGPLSRRGPVDIITRTTPGGITTSGLPLELDPAAEYPKGTGLVFPSKFIPPSDSVTPHKLFSGRRNWIRVTRHVLPNDPGTGIIYTDGACLNNGQANAKAGWAFWHGSGPAGRRLIASGRLEAKGPYGDDGAQSSNRAELRAVIAALAFRCWPGENFRKLVLATNSEYVVEGATNWVIKWIREGWTRRAAPGSRERTEVKNRDFWEVLLGLVEKLKRQGMDIEFWRIPREWNTVADAAAKEAADEPGAPPAVFEPLIGFNF